MRFRRYLIKAAIIITSITVVVGVVVIVVESTVIVEQPLGWGERAQCPWST